MTEWKARRFWEKVQVVENETGFAVTLDGRPLRSPAKAALDLPTRALATAIATEWEAQDKLILPQTMPLTRAANSALDKVAPQRDAVITLLAEYGATDLLCYRAQEPDALIRRQTEAWNPPLDWLAQTHGVRLATTAGVLPIDQDPAHLAQLRAEIEKLDLFALTGFHDLVMLSGSLVLALAVHDGALEPAHAWDISRCDEQFQIDQWGIDDEAAEKAAEKQAAFLAADHFIRLSRA